MPIRASGHKTASSRDQGDAAKIRGCAGALTSWLKGRRGDMEREVSRGRSSCQQEKAEREGKIKDLPMCTQGVRNSALAERPGKRPEKPGENRKATNAPSRMNREIGRFINNEQTFIFKHGRIIEINGRFYFFFGEHQDLISL